MAFGAGPIKSLGNAYARGARSVGAVTFVNDLTEMMGNGNKKEALNTGSRSTAKLLTVGVRGVQRKRNAYGKKERPESLMCTERYIQRRNWKPEQQRIPTDRRKPV